MTTSYLPGVVRVQYVSAYLVDVHFDDGTHKVVDISQWFNGPVFEPLKSKSYFRKFFVEGATIAWPNGVDISPEALYAAENHEGRYNIRLRRTRASARR